MSTLLIRHATVLVTMDAGRREIADGALFCRDGRVEVVGASADLPATADEVLDLTGHIVLPGLINTHHHLYQTLTRAVPAVQDADLFHWLNRLYPIWANLTPEGVYTSALTGLAELARSGCTTVFDHLYIYPNGARLDDEIRAAQEIGVRFHASRGSMSLGESQGGLPPDRVVEDEAFILKDSQRLVEQYHDPRPGAMLRIVLAPCSPFSVTGDLMRQSALLARALGVRLHTHLAETIDEEAFCLEKFGHRPVAYMETLGWIGDDVWFAHSVHVSEAELGLYASTGCGVSHCPSSNMRLGSGIAPIRRMRAAGVKVGLGVDGSASNDGNHMVNEARQALLLARLQGDPSALTARQALEMATLGGACVLGRDDIGSLAPGMSADLVAFDARGIGHAGAGHDPVAALLFCAPVAVSLSVIDGRVVVRDGELQTLDAARHAEDHRRLASVLL